MNKFVRSQPEVPVQEDLPDALRRHRHVKSFILRAVFTSARRRRSGG